MSIKKVTALKYLEALEAGNIKDLIDLFTPDAMIESPVYGLKKASDFYAELLKVTTSSELTFKGFFKDKDSNSCALYFHYKWILKNKETIAFDVVDIIDFDQDNKIKALKIIYNSINSQKAIDGLR